MRTCMLDSNDMGGTIRITNLADLLRHSISTFIFLVLETLLYFFIDLLKKAFFTIVCI
jgi:hypothetical protein